MNTTETMVIFAVGLFLTDGLEPKLKERLASKKVELHAEKQAKTKRIADVRGSFDLLRWCWIALCAWRVVQLALLVYSASLLASQGHTSSGYALQIAAAGPLGWAIGDVWIALGVRECSCGDDEQ